MGRGGTFFLNNFGIKVKDLSTNYKPVFIEFKNIIYFLNYLYFEKSF